MKQQVLCCLLLTIGIGTCNNHAGSFSKSFSSSSAAASSASSFSSSFSSSGDIDLNDITNSLKSASQSGSAAFADAGANDGAKAGSGSFSGSGSTAFSGAGSSASSGASSGSYSKSGSFSSSGVKGAPAINLTPGSNTGNAGSYSKSGSLSNSGVQGAPAVHLTPGSNTGSYSKSGPFSSTGSTCATCSGNSGHSVSSSGLDVGVAGGTKINAEGSHILNEKHFSNSGSTKGVIDVLGENPESIEYVQHHGSNPSQQDDKLKYVNNANSGAGSVSAGNVFENDFQIPVEFQNTKTKQTINKAITGSTSNGYKGGNSGSYQGTFPGPTGSIHDFKPAPPGGGNPPIWTPEIQKPVVVIPTQPRPVDTGYQQVAIDTGTTGLSSHLIHSFPGSHGSIYDSKPVYNKPNSDGKIPVAVIPVVVETPQYHQQPIQTHVPSVIGVVPGSAGSIHPAPSLDIISSFPGKPGNIHDSKVVPTSPCIGGHCESNKHSYNGNQQTNVAVIGVDVTGNHKPKIPDCSNGQCDQYEGKLGCYGNDCFGPGKKPLYAHFAAGSNANSNVHYEGGSINSPAGTYQHGCKSGNCNGKPVPVNTNCANGKCAGNVPHGINVQQPEIVIVDLEPTNVPIVIEEKPDVNVLLPPAGNNLPYIPEPGPGVITVDLAPINVPSGNEQKPDLNIYPAPGSINFGSNKPIPTYPGTLCSGIDCLLAPVAGTKQAPNSGCTGAYCINVIPEVQVTNNCLGEKCGNKAPNCIGNSCLNNNLHKNGYANSNTNVQKEKIPIIQPVVVETPFHSVNAKENTPKESTTTTNKPYDKGPSSSQDFLLPGNKPHHHHNIKSHQQTTQKKHDEGYYTCTGTSCPLPKHPGQIPSESSKINPSPGQQGCSGNGCTPQLQPFNIPDVYKGAGGHDRLYPDYNQKELPTDKNGPNCNGYSCSAPQLKPFNIPDEYKNDNKYHQKEQYPVDIPVAIELEPQIHENKPAGHYSGSNVHSGANGGSNSFTSGKVTVQKSDGIEVPVFDVKIPGDNKPGYSCTGGQCDGAKQKTDNGFVSGANSGSGGYYQENGKENGCSGSSCKTPQTNGCANGKCGSNGAQSGSYASSTSGSLQGNVQGSGCTTGKCGTGSNGGGYSGSGSYTGGSESTGTHHQGNGCSDGSCKTPSGNGCASGKCGLNNGAVSGSYASSSSGTFHGNPQGNGCTTGKCGTGSNEGSYSGSGSYGGVKEGCKGGTCGSPANSGAYSGSFSSSSSFSGSGSGAQSASGSNSQLGGGQEVGFEGLPLLKELLHQSIKGVDAHSGAGSFSGSSSYSGGGSSSHSSSYSSAGSFSAK